MLTPPITTFPAGLVTVLFKFLKVLFRPPKKKETAKDIAARNRVRYEFIDHVNQQAKATEQMVMERIGSYADYLLKLSQNELARYQINTILFIHQVDLLRMQVPGTIASSVSRRMTDTDAEYHRICNMLVGDTQEKAIQTFSAQIIQEGLEKCVEHAQSVFDYIEQELSAVLQEKADVAQLQLEKMQQELNQLLHASENQEQQSIKAKAELVIECCNLTENLFEKEVG